MVSANPKYQYPFTEAIILTCLALVLLAFTTSSILFLAYYFADLPLGAEPPPLLLAISVCFGLLVSYSLIIRLSLPFFLSVFLPQLRTSFLWFLLSLMAGSLFSLMVLWGGQFFSPPLAEDSTLLQILDGGPIAKNFLFISVIALAPIGEEYLFRGVLLSGLSQRFSNFWAIFLSSVVFMAFHLLEYSGYWFALVSVFLLGILLAVLRLRSQSMLVPIICHAGYNFIMLTLV